MMRILLDYLKKLFSDGLACQSPPCKLVSCFGDILGCLVVLFQVVYFISEVIEGVFDRYVMHVGNQLVVKPLHTQTLLPHQDTI